MSENVEVLAYFANEVLDAVAQVSPDLSVPAGAYITNLLSELVLHWDPADLSRPVCTWFHDISELGAYQQALQYRRLADCTLIRTGLFRPAMAKSPVSPAYYLALGASGYSIAVSLQRRFAMDDLLVEQLEHISCQMHAASDVMARVGRKVFPQPGEQSLLLHYDFCTETKSEHSRQYLQEHKITPISFPVGSNFC